MSQTMPLTAVESVAAVCRSLRPANQTSLLQFARFLKAQEAQAAFEEVDEEDEAEWDRMFDDPDKTANFARWADQSRERSAPKPIEPARL